MEEIYLMIGLSVNFNSEVISTDSDEIEYKLVIMDAVVVSEPTFIPSWYKCDVPVNTAFAVTIMLTDGQNKGRFYSIRLSELWVPHQSIFRARKQLKEY
jgi:hypothetical protein